MRKQRLIACNAVLVGIVAALAAQAAPDAADPHGHGKPDAAGRPGKAADAAGHPGKSRAGEKDTGKPDSAAVAAGADVKAAANEGSDKTKAGAKDGAESPRGAALGRRGALRELFEELKQGKLKKADVKERLGKLRESAAERRQQHQRELKERWGVALAVPSVREELQHHARRMARLNRALLVAETELTKDKDKLVERIQKLIDKEQTRHERAMDRVKSGTPASAVSAAAAADVAPKAGEK